VVSIGVDLGYGEVKVVGPNGRLRFPAVWAPYPVTAATWGVGALQPPIVVDQVPYAVGDDAATRPGARRPFADGRLADPDTVPLLAAALWLCGADGDIALGSGTPLGRFAAERDAARAALSGREFRLGDGHAARRVRIARLALRPQGVGAAVWLAGRGCLPASPGHAAVVDIGTRTTDVLTLRLANLSPVEENCFSLDLGAATAAESLAAEVQARTGRLPPADVAAAALRHPVPWGGDAVGGPAAAPHLDALAARIRDEVRRRFGGDAGRVVLWAAVGGGAVLLGDRLTGLLPGSQIAMAPDDAVFANAEGFRDAAARVGAL